MLLPSDKKISPIDSTTFRVSYPERHAKYIHTVGGSRSSEFLPIVETNLWDGECAFNISLRTLGKFAVPALSIDRSNVVGINADDGISFRTFPAIKRVTYTIPGTTPINYTIDFPITEFEIQLDRPIVGNTIEFDIEYNGLVFHKQPIIPRKGQIIPDDVKGSYAVFHATKANDYSLIGGQNYRQGKAFHLFRPRAYDSSGNDIWADIEIVGSRLIITIPQDFLEHASYPIRFASGLEFGNTGVPGSSYGLSENYMGVLFNQTCASTGTAQSMSCYQSWCAGGNWKGVICTDGGTPIITNGVTAGDAFVPETAGWETATFGTDPSVVASTVYDLGLVVDSDSCYMGCDEVASSGGYDETNSYASPSAPGNPVDEQDWGLYVTYAAAGGEQRATAGVLPAMTGILARKFKPKRLMEGVI